MRELATGKHGQTEKISESSPRNKLFVALQEDKTADARCFSAGYDPKSVLF
jgi:hypothetical protein